MQVYSQETEYQKYMIDVQSLKKEKNAELEFIAKSIASLKTVEANKMKIHEQICGHIAKNISIDLAESVSHVDSDVARLSIEKEMLEKKIIELEAKNMSLVINPHFLFNTLNCIARIAYFEHSHTTEELIYCLSDLLRYNLKQNDQLHTIASEIDNIEKYLYIQKVRFKNRLEYNIDVPEKIKAYRIPNMVIQPIVENALIHGITPKRDGGKINIYAEEFEKEIVISIEDNGSGFSKDVLDKIQQSENKSGLGFRSTDKRLKRSYGECYGLEIVKSDFSGSTVAIKIPTQPIGRC
jgi:sensor histidine kinase YesM